jgi:hypothetical protein
MTQAAAAAHMSSCPVTAATLTNRGSTYTVLHMSQRAVQQRFQKYIINFLKRACTCIYVCVSVCALVEHKPVPATSSNDLPVQNTVNRNQALLCCCLLPCYCCCCTRLCLKLLYNTSLQKPKLDCTKNVCAYVKLVYICETFVCSSSCCRCTAHACPHTAAVCVSIYLCC